MTSDVRRYNEGTMHYVTHIRNNGELQRLDYSGLGKAGIMSRVFSHISRCPDIELLCLYHYSTMKQKHFATNLTKNDQTIAEILKFKVSKYMPF